ncbi:hypothetical protein LTR28_006023 [Elasticomyces elasticus]|nr:hypothetical protein LTR28_006023 [Elasticomyces elasticus]
MAGANTLPGHSNSAAWITESKVKPFKVDNAPMPVPQPDEVVVKNHAVAVNPVDWKIQDTGFYVKDYPNVLGEDVAGEIAEVGSEVKGFKKGDRVISHALGLGTGKPGNGGFQHFTACNTIVVAKLPSNVSFTEGAVLPLAISTAAAGLYQPGYLELPFPSTSPKSTDKTLVVWGGSSSVGATTIQLAIASGVKVIATASKRNFDFVKSMGASEVFDYNSGSVVDDIVSAVGDKSKFAGIYDAISLPTSYKACYAIGSKLGGCTIATVLPPPEDVQKPDNVKANGVFAVTVATQFKQVGEAVWGKYVPEALEKGMLKCKPDPMIIGKGLESVQKGVDKNKEGVSAAKVVIEL